MKTSSAPQQSEHGEAQEKSPARAVPPVQRLQRAMGNLGFQQLIVQAKLQVGAADDPLEREADRVAEQVSAPQPCACGGGSPCDACASTPPKIQRSANADAPAGRSVPAAVLSSLGGGAPLDAGTRAIMQRHLGADLGHVRVHTNGSDAERAHAIGARAFTLGHDVVFGAGEYRPQTSEGQKLLAHELTHVVQQSGDVIRRAPDPAASDPPAAAPAAPVTLPSAETLEIPKERVRAMGANDLLIGVLGTRMVALPVQGQAWTIVGAPATPATTPAPAGAPPAPTPFVTIPTVGKEGLVGVNVGGNAAFLIDAGGSPAVVSPTALAAMQSALGTTSIRGVTITHAHKDHIQSLVAIVRAANIPPGNIFYPAAFEATLTPLLNQLRTDASLAPLGYGATATFSRFNTPAAGTFFHEQRVEGDVVFDYYALTAAMNTLSAARNATAIGKRADTASLLTRVTHQPSGTAILYVGDLRGGDLELFRTAMGAPQYDQMLRGVRVVQGLQHHLGALGDAANSPGAADRAGLTDLLTRVLLQGKPVTVMAQSTNSYRNLQFLNRGLIAGLNAMGVDVEVTLEESAPAGGVSQVGTVTVNTDQSITRVGGGTMESHPGSAAVKTQLARLVQLREAEEVLTRYGRFLRHVEKTPTVTETDVRAARDQLERQLTRYISDTIGNVGSDAAARTNQTVMNPTAQATSLTNLQNAGADVSSRLMPATMAMLRELSTYGRHFEVLEREMNAARTTGRLSEAGLEALWEVAPEYAQQIIRRSQLPKAEKRRVAQQVPGGPLPIRGRIVGGIMIGIELTNLAAPAIQEVQANRFNEHVVKGINDIAWWQSKGVQPKIEAVTNPLFSAAKRTEEVPKIKGWIEEGDLNYIALTSIDAGSWQHFMIWASANIRNYRDWAYHIAGTDTIQGSGGDLDKKSWSYRTGAITSAWVGFNLTTSYVHSPQLTLILNGVASAMMAKTDEELKARAEKPGMGMQPSIGAPGFQADPVLNQLPQAIGRRKFKPGVKPRLYTFGGHWERTGYSSDAVFYVYPNSAAPEKVPAGAVVVSAANFATYVSVHHTKQEATSIAQDAYGKEFTYNRRFAENWFEIMLADSDDLVPAE